MSHPWERLKGNEHVKHMLEVAAVDDLPVFLFGSPYYMKEIFSCPEMEPFRVEMRSPCPCGNYRDPIRECNCTEEMLSEYRGSVGLPHVLQGKLVCSLVHPTWEQLIAPSDELFERVTRRIGAAKSSAQHLDVPKLGRLGLGGDPFVLLRKAYEQFAYTLEDVETVLAAATSAASLDGATGVDMAAMAFAVQAIPGNRWMRV